MFTSANVAPTPQPPAEPGQRTGRRPPWIGMLLGVTAGLLSVLLLTGVVIRYGAETGPGRALIVRLVDGLNLGSVGRLHVKGLKGDVFSSFSLEALEIADAKGAWLHAGGVSLTWDPGELFGRRVHIARLWASDLHVFRQPVLAKQPPSSPTERPVTVILDDLRVKLETDPKVSVQHGLWDVKAKLILRRNNEALARIAAHSELHPGDGLDLDAALGKHDRMHLRAEGVEAAGGALAGLLGLPADRRLAVHAKGDATQVEGMLEAKIDSGDQSPLNFTAHWDKGGAQAKGRLDLAASHLTHYFSEHLGPTADIDLNVRPQGRGELYAARGQLVAQHGRIDVDGPVNWRTRRAENLGVKLALDDLSKWLSIPKIGATRIEGTVVGGVDDFVLKGRFDGADMDQSTIKLAHASGPATVTRAKGEWRIQSELQGSGGSGPAPLGPLVGASPKISLDVSVMKDSRFLIRTLDIAGSGVSVQATGGLGLFGELSFKGTAQIVNLNPIHAGAHGQLVASWDAVEPKGTHLWGLTVDAKGANFATGMPELDRYLGAQPHFTAKGNWADEKLTFERADLSGGALQASGHGVFGPQDAMNFDIDWTAKGPFIAGPVEVAGQAKGSGKLTGTIANPRADLVAELASVDFGRLVITPAKLTLTLLKGPDGLDGVAALEGPTDKYGHASGKTAFHFVEGGMELTDLVADAAGVKIAGRLALKNNEPSTANLTLNAGPGAFLSTGKLNGALKLVDQPGGTQAQIALDGQGLTAPDLPLSLRALHLSAVGSLAKLPFQVSAESNDPIAWSFKGSGIYAGGRETVVTLNGGGKLRKSPFSTQAPAEVRFGPEGSGAKLHLTIAGGHADIDARLNSGDAQARAELANVGLGAILQDFTGTVSGSLSLGGKGARLDGSADLTLEGARSSDEPAKEALSGKLMATLAGARIHLAADAANPEGLKSNLDLDLPAEASAAPFRIAIDRTRMMNGHFTAEGEIRPLWDLVAGGERTLSGQVSVHATLGGTIADPSATGDASLAKGEFRDVGTGLALKNLQTALNFNHTLVTVSQFTGVDARGGSLTGEGRVSLERAGGSTFTLTAKKFQLIDNDIGRASASGEVTLTRDADGKARLAGSLIIDKAEFAANPPVPTGVVPMDVVEINQPLKEGVEKPFSSGAPPVFALDVSLKAARGVVIRGKGLDAEMSLDAHVGGFVSKPELTGTARVVRGYYDFAGQRFDIDDRGTVKLATAPDKIILDLTATRDDPSLTAVVRVKGTAAKPEITLTSSPVLPQDEVLSRVLFGVSAAQLSPGQTAQLASSLASLNGGGGFDVIGNLRQFAGLDRLALGGTQASGTTVSAGRYLTSNVYLELTGGGRTGPSAEVEWRVRRDLSLVSQVGTQGDARLSFRFRKDY